MSEAKSPVEPVTSQGDPFLVGGGEIADLIARLDWAATPLGPIEGWPSSLRTTVAMMLRSPLPIASMWGPQGTMIYNAGYARIAGGRHPDLFGLPVREAWPEAAEFNSHVMTTVLAGGTLSYADQEFTLYRSGTAEQVWLNLDYSPVLDARGVPIGVIAFVAETTDMVKAQRLLRQSEARLRALTHTPSSIVYRMSADWNEMRTLQGRGVLEDAEAPTVAWMDVYLLPEDRDGTLAAIERAIRDKTVFELEHRVRRADGSVGWVASRAIPIFDDRDQIAEWFGSATDITARRESEARLRFLHALDGEIGKALEADAAMAIATRMLGRQLGVAICAYADMEPDQDHFNIRGDWTAPGSASIVGYYSLADFGELAVRRLSAGEPLILNDNLQELPPDEAATFQSIGIAATICMPLVKDGRLTALMAIHDRVPRRWTRYELDALREVTERCWAHVERVRSEQSYKESTDRLRLATDASSVGIFDYNPLTGALKWDARCKELFGLPPEEDVSYEGTFLAGLHRDDRAAADQAVRRALNAPEPFDIEYRTIGLRDGIERWVAARGHAVFDNNVAVRFAGTVIDITSRKKIERDLQREIADRTRAEAALQSLNATLEHRVAEEIAERSKAEEKLRQSQKMEAVGQLTGGIAHDFNNMLAVIIGGLNLVQRKVARGEKDVDRFIEGAMEGARRAASLTQRLLAFSRQQPLQPTPIDANRMVGGMSEMLSRTLGETIVVETVLAAGLWKVAADAPQLESALLNLSVNARDAMPGGGKLTIETANASIDERYADEYAIAPGQYVLIAVSDTGTGMTPDIVAKAFDPFFTTKSVGKGTGLGLSQVYGFVRQSGGSVKIYSEPGVGSAVKIYLPRYYGDMPPGIDDGVRRSSQDGVLTETILVVEDEERVRHVSVEALRDLGYTVLEAEGPRQALAIVESGQPISLLFTDVVMPEMSGRELADAVRRIKPDIRVLFTTGYTRNAIVHNGVLDAGTQLLSKPFSVDELAAKVRAILDGDILS